MWARLLAMELVYEDTLKIARQFRMAKGRLCEIVRHCIYGLTGLD